MTNVYREAYTFDDVLLVPRYSDLLPNQVDLSTQLTSNINLRIPIISSAMDTVTESNLAIALAQNGGLGFIHKNMSIENQVNEILKVKKHKYGVIQDPLKISLDCSVQFLNLLFHSSKSLFCVVISNENKFLGIVEKSVVDLLEDKNVSVSEIMISINKLNVINEKDLLNMNMKSYFKEENKEMIFVINNSLNLVSIITDKILKYKKKKCNSSVDKNGNLMVGAAVGIDSLSKKRADSLISSGVDVLLVDSSHGHSKSVLSYIEYLRKKYPDSQIIGGNVVTAEGAKSLVESGSSAVKVGIGSGSICTTRIVTGVGVPQITSILDVYEFLKEKNIPLISDGGIRNSGDIAKALAAGASVVMIGSILAGSQESPGKIIEYNGKLYKKYRGMGSMKAMLEGSFDRYFYNKKEIKKFVPEGIESIVPYKGLVKDIIFNCIGGLKSCMGLTGCLTIKDLRTKTDFVKVSNSGLIESRIHDVIEIN